MTIQSTQCDTEAIGPPASMTNSDRAVEQNRQRWARILAARPAHSLLRERRQESRAPGPIAISVQHTSAIAAVTGDALLAQRAQRNDLSKTVAAFGPILRGEDHALLEAVIVRGQSMAMVARIVNRPVASIRRRIKALMSLITSFEFEYVLCRRAAWPPRRRCVADACFLRGLSIKKAARDLRLSFSQVRRERTLIGALAREARAA